MVLGYDKPLYLLPFDHRHSYVTGILVDEELGADILRDALMNGYITVLSTEKSGGAEFEFEYGAAPARVKCPRCNAPARRSRGGPHVRSNET